MRTKLFLCFVIVSILSLTPVAAWADSITIQNASFESTNTLNIGCGTGCAFNTGPIPGWTLTGLGGSFQPNSTFFNLPVPDGTIVGYSNGGSISQTLGVSLVPNSLYTLSVFVGDRLDGVSSGLYSIALMDGATTLCSFSGYGSSINPGTFADKTCSFASGPSVPNGKLSIVLASGGIQADFDNVSLTATPEPSSQVLVGAGLLFVALLFLGLKDKHASVS